MNDRPVWVIDVWENDHLNLNFTKVVEAPKYLVQNYAKAVLKAMGVYRIKKLDQYGTRYGGSLPVWRGIRADEHGFAQVILHQHVVRDRTWLEVKEES